MSKQAERFSPHYPVIFLPEDYAALEDAGAKNLDIARQVNTVKNWRVASTDIQTTTGVVHALGYDFKIINF